MPLQIPTDPGAARHNEGTQTAQLLRLGRHVVGFSKNPDVQIEFQTGEKGITLRDVAGDRVLRIPALQDVEQAAMELARRGLTFSQADRETIETVVRSALVSSPGVAELQMMMDELARAAPASTVREVSYVHAGISGRESHLLRLFPEEVQTLLLLSNLQNLPPGLAEAYRWMDKIQPEVDTLAMRFIRGEIPFSDSVARAMLQIAQRPSDSGSPGSVTLDHQAMLDLARWIDREQISLTGQNFGFSPAVLAHALTHFDLIIPENLQHEDAPSLLSHLRAGFASQRMAHNALETKWIQFLEQYLQAALFPDLARFLSGQGPAHVGPEIRTQALELLKQPVQEASDPLTWNTTRALDLLKHLLQSSANTGMDANAISQRLSPGHTALPTGTALLDLMRVLQTMSPSERQAVWILDRVDAQAHPLVHRFFSHAGPSAPMHPSIARGILELLATPNLSSAVHGLEAVTREHISRLSDFLGRTGFPAPPAEEAFPMREALRQTLLEHAQLFGTSPRASSGPVSWRKLWVDITGDKAPKGFEARLSLLERNAHRLNDSDVNRLLTGLLKRHLAHFHEVAALDHVFQAQHTLKGEAPQEGPMSSLLHRLQALLLRKEPDRLMWTLWKAFGADEASGSALKAVLGDVKGMKTYPMLDSLVDRDFEHRSFLGKLIPVAERLGSLARTLETGQPLPKAIDTQALWNDLEQLVKILITKKYGIEPQTAWLSPEKMRMLETLKAQLPHPDAQLWNAFFQPPFQSEDASPERRLFFKRLMARLQPQLEAAVQRAQVDTRDIASQLERFLSSSPHTAKPGAERPVDAITRFLETVRDFNQFQNLNDGPLYLSIPWQFQEHRGHLDLMLFKPRRQQTAARRYVVAIHLDFEAWGHLRVDAVKDRQDLSATFWAETPRMLSLIRRHLPRLASRIEAHGLLRVSLEARLSPQRACQTAADLCQLHDGDETLNLTI